MNKIIKLFFFSLIIFFSITFYKIYFKEKTIAEKDFEIIPNVEEKEYENNLIKDLKYSINLGQNNKYIINSELSEITYQGGSEVVNMQGVTAFSLTKIKFLLKFLQTLQSIIIQLRNFI